MNKFLILCLTFLIQIPANAQSWQPLGLNSDALKANSLIVAICVDTSDGSVYAAGQFRNTAGYFYVAKWNGTSWTELGSGSNSLNGNGAICALCIDAAHNIYAGGAFSNASGKYYVAKWNGSTWAELGMGSNALNANAPINYSICVDGSGNIYTAGDFTDGDSATTGKRYVAKWDGSTWSKLGTGSNALNVNDVIRTLATDINGYVYAAGSFSDSGYSYVAMWNGASWSKLGVGTNKLFANGSIWNLISDNAGNIYSSGFFSNDEGYYYVAKWNGATWNELGNGSHSLKANSDILSISLDKQNNVYAAGSFSNSNGETYVARWDGTTWTELGQGSGSLKANGDISTTCVDYQFNVYAAGGFTDSTPGHGYKYVAKYDQTLEVPTLKARTITIYPNPVLSTLHAVLGNKSIGGEYFIIDISMKVVRQSRLHVSSTDIDVSDLTAGTYLFQLKDHPGLVYKFLKQ